jgi:glycosyltransferase involved in cell wall biosynthesis
MRQSEATAAITAAPAVPRFGLVSHNLPPSRFGQSRMLYRLLSGLPTDRYILASTQDYDRARPQPRHDGPWLPADYLSVPSGFGWRFASARAGLQSLPRRMLNFANLALALPRRARALAQLLRAHGVEAVVACSGDPLDLPAAALAARWLRRPFLAYMFDDYGVQFRDQPALAEFAALCDRLVARSAACIIVPNEALRDAYAARYGLAPVIVRNPHAGIYPAPRQPVGAEAALRIVYTGALYHAQLDAMERLVAVVEAAARPVLLDVYSSFDSARLPVFAGTRRVRHHGHVSDAEAAEAQASADLLFLPLAFDSPVPEVVRTAHPAKFSDYLASGRPLLVHAPADSFVATYCRRHGCAHVVDVPSTSALAAALEVLSSDEAYRRRLVAAALDRARRDLAPEAAREAFCRAVREGCGWR